MSTSADDDVGLFGLCLGPLICMCIFVLGGKGRGGVYREKLAPSAFSPPPLPSLYDIVAFMIR